MLSMMYIIAVSLALLLTEQLVIANRIGGVSGLNRFGEPGGGVSGLNTLECSGRANLYGRNGSFTSPGYPYSFYQTNEVCRFLITVSPGSRVLLYFTSFQLEAHTSCSHDSVQVYDGTGQYASRLAKICGSELPAPVYSSGRHMFVEFSSDSYSQHRGFKAKFVALSNSTRCPLTDSDDSAGVIYSPGFPWSYPNLAFCTWYITAPSGMKVFLNITTLFLDPGSCSDNLYLSYVSGYSTRKLCGPQSYPVSFMSSGRSLRVRFSSDSSRNWNKGFLAYYQYVPQYTTVPPTPMSWWTPTQYPYSKYGCNRYSDNDVYVESTVTIASPGYPNILPQRYNSFASWTCSWRIVTYNKDYLELTFDDMSIGNCGYADACYCGKVTVRDDSARGNLGTFCRENTRTVTSKGNAISVTFYADRESDIFKATSRAKNRPISVAGVVVPIIVGITLFGIILGLVKCVKKIPATEQPSPSEVPVQWFPGSENAIPPYHIEYTQEPASSIDGPEQV